jgi:hypothetical protein
MSASLALENVPDTLTHLAHLEDLRMAGTVNEANHLVLGVEVKVDAGQPLTPLQYGILWNCVTEESVDFIRQHQRELLG